MAVSLPTRSQLLSTDARYFSMLADPEPSSDFGIAPNVARASQIFWKIIHLYASPEAPPVLVRTEKDSSGPKGNNGPNIIGA